MYDNNCSGIIILINFLGQDYDGENLNLIKTRRLITITALLVCSSTFATPFPTASAFCPLVAKLSHNESGRWEGQNADGKHFESHMSYSASGIITELLVAKTEIIDNYKIKCFYQASEESGVKYVVALFNEHDYQLCPDNSIISEEENCPEE